MTVGVDYGFGFFISPKQAVDGDELSLQFSLIALDNSSIPENTRVRLNIFSSGETGIFSRSVIRTLEFGTTSFEGTIQSGLKGGSLRFEFPSVHIGDEEEPRTISGASRTVSVLPIGARLDPPEGSDTTSITAATSSNI